jgi:LL-diaminopimelate aminotransferase
MIYERRRDAMVKALREMGLRVTPPKASLYIWAGIPEGYTAEEFATRLLEDTGVVVTPGTGYGRYGEGYVRLSLTATDDEIAEGLDRLSRWHASGGKG